MLFTTNKPATHSPAWDENRARDLANGPRGNVQALVLSFTNDKSCIPIFRNLGVGEQAKLLEIIDQASNSFVLYHTCGDVYQPGTNFLQNPATTSRPHPQSS